MPVGFCEKCNGAKYGEIDHCDCREKSVSANEPPSRSNQVWPLTDVNRQLCHCGIGAILMENGIPTIVISRNVSELREFWNKYVDIDLDHEVLKQVFVGPMPNPSLKPSTFDHSGRSC